MKKKSLLRKQKATTKMKVMSTRYKGAESCGLRGNKENEMLVSVEAKHKMVKKPFPNYVV